MAVENLYRVLLVCCLHIFSFGGSHVRKLTSEDLRNIGKFTNKDYIAVFFDKPCKLKYISIDAWKSVLKLPLRARKYSENNYLPVS